MSAIARKPNSPNLQVRRQPTQFEQLVADYGETLALSIQARQDQTHKPFSSLSDNSQLESWEIDELREAQVLKAREERQFRFEQYAKARLKKIDGPHPASVRGTTILYFVQKHRIWLLASQLFRFLRITQKEKEKALQHLTSTHIRNVPPDTPGISSAQLLLTLEGAEIAASLYHQQELFNAVKQALPLTLINQERKL